MRFSGYLSIVLALWVIACNDTDVNLPGGSDDQGSDLLDIELEQIIARTDPKGLEAYILPDEEDWKDIPQDPRNPITPEKIELGKLLFHETGFAIHAKNDKGMKTYSCASCHHVDAGFQAGRRQGIGDGGLGFGIRGEGRKGDPAYHPDSMDVQSVRTPTVINVAYQPNQIWNGQFGATHKNQGTEDKWVRGEPTGMNYTGFQGPEAQAIAGLKIHRIEINDSLTQLLGYQEMFDKAFSGFPAHDRYHNMSAGLAIAAYERILVSNQAPFQKWLRGEKDAMTDQEKEGAMLFFGKAECVNCHKGPALNEMEFYALGFNDLTGPDIFSVSPSDDSHLGRGGFTERAEDMYKFKVPQLYNLKDSPFLGHGGTFHTIRSVIEYKNKAIPENPNVPPGQLAEEFHPLGLTDEEIDAITIFIQEGLYDPYLSRYVPEHIPSGKCFPNNDEITRIDLGCD